MLRRSLRIHPEDSVMCVLEDAHKGDTVETPEGEKIILLEDIEFGHKVAIKDLKKGNRSSNTEKKSDTCLLMHPKGPGSICTIWAATGGRSDGTMDRGKDTWNVHLWDTKGRTAR